MKTDMSEVKCHLCLSEDIVDYDENRWCQNNVIYGIKKCRGCGSAFTFPLPDDEFLENFYRQSFNYAWYEDHLYAKKKDSRVRYNEYKNYLGRSCLDYGGGLGYFSQVCRDNGIESLTFDPYTTKVIDKQKWDSVVSLHALEHSNDPNKFIQDISSRLTPGGKLILAVPNFDGLGYKTYKMHWVWAQPPFLHIFHLSTDGVIELLKRNGFTDIELSYNERWDANNYADVYNRQKFAKRDALWSNKFINKIKYLRKITALINSLYREYALSKSKKINDLDNNYSELQMIATKGL